MDDEERVGTWSIGTYLKDASGVEVKPWELYSAKEWLGEPPLTGDILVHGQPLAFDMVALEVPIVNKELLQVIAPLLERHVQIIPVRLKGFGLSLDYFVINVLDMLDCLALDQSEYIPWLPEEVKPWRNKLGHAFGRPAINQKLTWGSHMFRLKDWGLNRLIVSNDIQDILDGLGVRYLRYEPVLVIAR